MISYTREEFVEYVKNLEFQELEDVAAFVTQYYEYYNNIPGDKKEEKDEAWQKYMILQAKFGMMFVSFTYTVIEYRKQLNDEIEKEAIDSAGSLEDRTS
jgi:hypothetical protein